MITVCTSWVGAERPVPVLARPPTLMANTTQEDVHAQRAFLGGEPREGVEPARSAASELQAAEGRAERRVHGSRRLDGGLPGSGAVRGSRFRRHRQVPQAEAD